MALLLAMYQKMRLIREKNQATLDLTKYSGKLSRVTKNIERVQKRYTSILANLDKQAQMMTSNASVWFNNQAGLGTGNFTNTLNPMGFTGMNGYVYNVMANMFKNDITNRKDAEGNPLDPIPLGTQLFNQMYQEYMTNGGRFIPELDENNQPKYDENGNPIYKNGYMPEQVQAFMQAQQTGQMQQQQAQMQVQQANQQYANNVSIWLEARKAEVEAEQEAALEPLSYQETMWELEKNQAEAKLERIKQELESYNSLVSNEMQNSVPKFGLG